MSKPTEGERRLQELWERAADKAVSDGFPAPMVAKTMFAAAIARLLAGYGPEIMAQHLGRLAVACHEQAGGEIEEFLPGEGDNDEGPRWKN